MNKNHKNMAPDNFDALMLQIIIKDHNINKEIKKSVDMNANYVFSMQSSPAIEVIADKKISALLKNSRKWKWILFRISSIIGVITFLGVVLYNIIPTPNSGSNLSPISNSILAATIGFDEEDIIDTLNNYEKNTENNGNIHPIIPGILQKNEFIYKDTANNEDTEIKLQEKEIRPEGIYASYVPNQSFNNNNKYRNFNFSYAEEVTKKHKADVKINIGNYIMNGGIWKNSIPVSPYSNETSILIPTYSGEPFSKMFKNMTYFLVPYIFSYNDLANNLRNNLHLKPRSIYPDRYKFNFPDPYSKEYDMGFFEQDDNYKLLKPFYISNTEVSNFDYLEFVEWVKKYNGFDSLSEKDYRFGHEAFEYTFHKQNQEVEKHVGSNTINIHPNTECWRQRLSHNEPLVELYLRHPAFQNYPVVGISYWQALAFVDWLTYTWQTRMEEQNIPYEIEFDLPTYHEWSYAAENNVNGFGFTYSEDHSLLCELALRMYPDSDLRKTLNIPITAMRMTITPNNPGGNKFQPKNFSYNDITCAVNNDYNSNINFLYKIKNRSNIKNMDANVSEWIKMDYSPIWDNYISKARETLLKKDNPATQQALAIEKYFDDTYNNKNGKMIRGSNWLNDGVFNPLSILEAVNAKVFEDPDSQLPTVGFRYVMRVSLKKENEIAKKINIIGRNLENIDYSLLKTKKTSKYYTPDPNGFVFVPEGSFNFKDTITTVNSFWAQKTEVTNLEWMLFLNYLIDNKLDEKLKKCIPNDKDWKMKMTFRMDTTAMNIKLKDQLSYLPFPKQFTTENKIDKIEFTPFAFEPVTGISHEAAQIFAKWLSEMYGYNKQNVPAQTFRLPTEEEWEYMALGGNKSNIYSWDGYYVKNIYRLPLARFNALKFIEIESIDSTTKTPTKKIIPYNYDEIKELPEFIKIVQSQNSEFTLNMNDSINWAKKYGPLPVGMFYKNNYGLFDLSGNVAEMINDPVKTKGGSWASIVNFIEIRSEEKWNGKPSDCVGFRLVREYINTSR